MAHPVFMGLLAVSEPAQVCEVLAVWQFHVLGIHAEREVEYAGICEVGVEFVVCYPVFCLDSVELYGLVKC